jgi:hypothetical protein
MLTTGKKKKAELLPGHMGLLWVTEVALLVSEGSTAHSMHMGGTSLPKYGHYLLGDGHSDGCCPIRKGKSILL